MSIQDSKTTKRRWPLWILLIGLLGIGNFVVGFWSLGPPNEGDTVYFWLVRFYSYTFIPMLIILPVSMIIVTLWFSDLAERSWLQDTIILFGIVIAMLCCYLAFVIFYFAPTIRYVAHVGQNNKIYYLVGYIDDRADAYEFCESDGIGFSGQCRFIGWHFSENGPELYIDPATEFITVKFENSNGVWCESFPPNWINNVGESNDEEPSSGCEP